MVRKKKVKKPDNPEIQKPKGKVGDKDDRARIRAQVEIKIAEAVEALQIRFIMTRKVVSTSGYGPGNTEEYLKQVIEGYKDIFQANGIQVPSDMTELWEQLKEEPYGGDKKHGPRVIRLNQSYGVVPPSTLEKDNSSSASPRAKKKK